MACLGSEASKTDQNVGPHRGHLLAWNHVPKVSDLGPPLKALSGTPGEVYKQTISYLNLTIVHNQNYLIQTMVSRTDALIAGSISGFVVDISLFPIDTIKTRMQSRQGLKILGISDLHKLRGVG